MSQQGRKDYHQFSFIIVIYLLSCRSKQSCIIQDVWEMGKNHPTINIFAGGSGLRVDGWSWTERNKQQQSITKLYFFTVLNPYTREQKSKHHGKLLHFVCVNKCKNTQWYSNESYNLQSTSVQTTYIRETTIIDIKIIELIYCNISRSRGRTKCKWRNNHSSWLWQNVGSSTTCTSA